MKKVMLVDDDEGVVYTAARMLKTEGLKVIPALSGEECLRKLRTVKPDCIILDIMMPDMDGWEVMKPFTKDELLKSLGKVGILPRWTAGRY